MSTNIKFSYHGLFLISHSLPRSPLQLKQDLFITEWGDDLFADAVENIAFINNFFIDKLSSMYIKPYKIQEEYRSFPLLYASHRYFTPQDAVPYEHLSPFPVAMDPCQLLYSYARRSNRPLVNIQENTVNYLQFLQDSGTGAARYISSQSGQQSLLLSRYGKCSPGAFEISDLVRIELSFVLFANHSKRKGNGLDVQPVLRSLILLDSTEQNVCHAVFLIHFFSIVEISPIQH